ncbi:MAG: glutathione S-transferase family protein, partial [Rhodovulum sp.]
MLALNVFSPALGTISPSPFSVKALLLLEMSGLPYTRCAGDPRKAPRGKLPVLVDGGEAIPDSEAIRAHLARAHGFDPDAALNARQRAEAAAIRALVEDHLYWALVHARWIDRAEATRAAFFGRLPAPLRGPIFALVRRQVARALHGQGMGRHPAEAIYSMGADGLVALAKLVGEAPYVFGDRPSSIDTVVFGFLENVIAADLDTPLKDAALGLPALVAYHRRLRS